MPDELEDVVVRCAECGTEYVTPRRWWRERTCRCPGCGEWAAALLRDAPAA